MDRVGRETLFPMGEGGDLDRVERETLFPMERRRGRSG